MSQDSGRNGNNIPDLMRAMHVKVSIKDGNISNLTTGERLERFGAAEIVEETNGSVLDLADKIESRLWSTTPGVGAVL